jgi:hypothetical protein
MTACAVGRRHPPDSKLEQNFLRHESEFAALLTDVMADEKLKMIGIHGLRYGDLAISGKDDLSGLDALGMTKERLAQYRQRLRNLGLVQVTKGESGVEFRVEQGSISNGDSYKGYEHDVTPPEHQKLSLDGYRISAVDRDRFGDYYVRKPIKGHWYLYLFVNR